MKTTQREIREIVEGLLERTRQGLANWQVTGVEDQFILRFKTGSIIVDKYYSEKGEAYSFSIFNKSGLKIDLVEASINDDSYHLLRDLFNEVVEMYSRIEETIHDLLEEINSGDRIGRGKA